MGYSGRAPSRPKGAKRRFRYALNVTRPIPGHAPQISSTALSPFLQAPANDESPWQIQPGGQAAALSFRANRGARLWQRRRA
jgi:hypothetical protein